MEARSSSSEDRLGSRNRGLGAILPATISVVAVEADLPDAPLFPEEAVAIGGAVEARRREFATGRACARAALAQWGLAGRAIPSGPGGEPRWPPGVVGSITHCDGYRACAVGRDADLLAIGIDAEPNEPLSARLLAAVSSDDEAAMVRRLARREPGVRWDRLLFSAKEAAYKAWFPFLRRRLGFGDARLSFGSRERTFLATLEGQAEVADAPRELEGRWTLDGGLVLAAVVVTGPDRGSAQIGRWEKLPRNAAASSPAGPPSG